VKKKKLVSVILTVYNEEKLLKKSLNSLFSQTYRPLEMVIIDDGSTDKTPEILSEIKAANSKVQVSVSKFQVFRQEHQGLGAARNLGAKKSQGEVIVFVDADIIYDRDYLKNLVKPILEKGVVGTFHNEELVANMENKWAKCWNINDHVPLGRRQHPGLKESVYFRAVERKTFLKGGGFDNVGYLHDRFLAEKLGEKAKVAPKAKCYHHNPDSAGDVFLTARYLGKGLVYSHKIRTILQYSPLNTLRRIILDTKNSKEWFFPIFKIVFDFGVNVGAFQALLTGQYAGK
jgi:glycosyltransferase involved in cell wall biosynthesis